MNSFPSTVWQGVIYLLGYIFLGLITGGFLCLVIQYMLAVIRSRKYIEEEVSRQVEAKFKEFLDSQKGSVQNNQQ